MESSTVTGGANILKTSSNTGHRNKVNEWVLLPELVDPLNHRTAGGSSERETKTDDTSIVLPYISQFYG